MIKIINIVGTRPNFMKIAPLMHEMKKSKVIEPILLHTGQHYDENMSEKFFRELHIPEPDIHLNVGSGTHAKQVANIMELFDDVCEEIMPDAVLVVGDVNSTMACSLVAVKKGIKVIHVEAGIRSGDKSMPEEINRLVTDSIADVLFPPSQDAVDNLLREGKSKDQIFLVGNIMIDTLKNFSKQVSKSKIVNALKLSKRKYAVLTLHRPSNVDSMEPFLRIFNALKAIQESIPIVFPVHPRTRKMLEEYGLMDDFGALPGMIFTEPLGYIDFGRLLSDARFVLTDSGGIQEETTIYKVPCITLRENTERPITITEGTNELAGSDTNKIIELATKIMDGKWKKARIPDLWDGKTASRIVYHLENDVNYDK